MPDLETLLGDVRACRVCVAHLPLGPRPVLRAAAGGLVTYAFGASIGPNRETVSRSITELPGGRRRSRPGGWSG